MILRNAAMTVTEDELQSVCAAGALRFIVEATTCRKLSDSDDIAVGQSHMQACRHRQVQPVLAHIDWRGAHTKFQDRLPCSGE